MSLQDSAIGRVVSLMHVALLCLFFSQITFTFAAENFCTAKPLVASVTNLAQDCNSLPRLDQSHRD